MYCPNCGTKGDIETQFCRACGEDLRAAGTAAETSEDRLLSAKERIGRAFANRIEAVSSAKELGKVSKDVLPKIESFFETPEEKRLKRIRVGSVVSFVGLGVAIGFLIAALFGDPEIIVMSAMGFVVFFVGLSLVINGMFFTIPKQMTSGAETPADLYKELPELERNTNELLSPAPADREFFSVTDNTTRTLDDKIPLSKKKD
jgi:hypothetical protein